MPESPSELWPAHIEAIRHFHENSKTFNGQRTLNALPSLKFLFDYYRPKTLLDYGCGKGQQWELTNFEHLGTIVPSLQEHLGVDTVCLYDPGLEKFSEAPRACEATIVNDVLEYIPEDDVLRVLDEIFSLTGRFVFICVSGLRPKKPCVVDTTWNKTGAFWMAMLSRVSAKYPQAHVYVRLADKELLEDRSLYCGKGGIFERVGEDQFVLLEQLIGSFHDSADSSSTVAAKST